MPKNPPTANDPVRPPARDSPPLQPGSTKLSAIGLLLLLLCGSGFVVGVFFMAKRVSSYYQAAPPAQFEFTQLKSRTLKPFGHELTINDGTMPDSRPALDIRFGSQSLLLPVHPPKLRAADLPPARAKEIGLSLYDEWVALLAFAPVEKGVITLDPEHGNGRVILVKRNAAPGNDDDMGGSVNRKNWTFDLIEFLPSGAMSPLRTLQFPATDYRTGEPYLPAKRADPATTIEPIAERSYEFQSVLYAIPKMQIANYRYKTDAVKGSSIAEGMGWTLPLAAFSVMGIVLGIILTAIGRKAPTAPTPTPPRSIASKP